MAKVLVVNECHLQCTPDGSFWSNGIVDYQVFSRPLNIFEQVFVAIRVSYVEQKDVNYIHRCDGKNVEILPLPDYQGMRGYLKNMSHITGLVKTYCDMADCAIIRTPSAVSNQFIRIIEGKMPYAIEVSGDPWKHMARGEYKSIFRPVIRIAWTLLLRKNCMHANGVSYVTKNVLQMRYSCRAIKEGESERYFTSHYSTVSIPAGRKYEFKKYEKQQEYHIIHVANAFTTYGKGHKEAIEIVDRLNRSGINTMIEFVGDGPLKSEFRQYAKAHGIEDKVSFIGRLNSKEEVWEKLRKADLFLFPTHSEGLPRVVIESMYVGTPVVSTNAGGIPELLEKEFIADVGDTGKMYELTEKLLMDPERMTQLSKEYVMKSQEYTEESLQMRRTDFYTKLRNLCR